MGREKKNTTTENTKVEMTELEKELHIIPMHKHTFSLILVEEMLGTNPNNETIYADWVASKAPTEELKEEEIESFSVDPDEDKGTTIFAKEADGTPYIRAHWVKGFFKAAGRALNKTPGSITKSTKAFIKEIENEMDVSKMHIPIDLHGMKIGYCERALRAQTPQGERVALARSESVPEGSTLTFVVKLYKEEDIYLVYEWFNHGLINGLGQWRNGGKGKFIWEEHDEFGNRIIGNDEWYFADLEDDDNRIDAAKNNLNERLNAKRQKLNSK